MISTPPWIVWPPCPVMKHKGSHGRGRLSDYLCLGVVSRIYQRYLVDEVIAETQSKEKRNRLLPGWSSIT